MNEDEPVGYDGHGAPLYPWQQTKPLGWNKPPADIRPLMNMIDETVRAMLIPTVELPEAFRRYPYPLPFEEKHPIADAFEAQYDINQTHKKLEHDSWHGWKEVGYLSSDSLEMVPEDPEFRVLIQEHAQAIVKAQDDVIRYRLETWCLDVLETWYGNIDYDRILAVTGQDFRRPLCDQELPSRGQE